MILFIVPLAAWLYNQASNIANGAVDFLRSVPSFFAPKPSTLGIPYSPPFTGGQTPNALYRVQFEGTNLLGVKKYLLVGENLFHYTRETPFSDAQMLSAPQGVQIRGAIVGNITNTGGFTIFWLLDGVNTGITTSANGAGYDDRTVLMDGTSLRIYKILRQDGTADTGGNLPNPTPNPPINDDGLFKPNNPYITDSNDVVNPAAIVLAPALPLVLVPLISSAIAAALSAARAAGTALEAIQKVAEALEGLAELWKKLKEFLDEWEKSRPKKRDITRQTYGRIEGDGALDFFAPNSTKVEAIQLDIIVTNIPIGFGRYFGSMSPSRYRYRELGYIAFYSVNQGILEVHSLQFKRNTLQIPPLAVGFIYHFGLDNQIKAFAFGTFSIEKS